MKSKKKSLSHIHHIVDLAIVCIYELLVPIITVALHFKFYQSTILFFFVPGIFLILRKTKKIKHILLASLGGLGFGFVFDFVATLNHAWFIPQDQLALPRLLGIVPLDDLIWFAGWIFFMTTFYEHFLDNTRNKQISPHLKWGVTISLTLMSILVVLFYVFPSLLQIHYAYLICFACALPFAFYVLVHKPILLLPIAKLTAFFAPMLLLYELSALMTHQWIFPGFYIGHVEILGLVMPFEEFFFWIFLSSCVVLSYYEFFVEEK